MLKGNLSDNLQVIRLILVLKYKFCDPSRVKANYVTKNRKNNKKIPLQTNYTNFLG